MNCERCALFSRLRKVVGYLKSVLSPDQNDIYLYEQVTGFYDWMKRAFAERNVVGSEYLGAHLASGAVVNGVRHEDALAMSFADESFDYLISCDVFEHVPDIKRTPTGPKQAASFGPVGVSSSQYRFTRVSRSPSSAPPWWTAN